MIRKQTVKTNIKFMLLSLKNSNDLEEGEATMSVLGKRVVVEESVVEVVTEIGDSFVLSVASESVK